MGPRRGGGRCACTPKAPQAPIRQRSSASPGSLRCALCVAAPRTRARDVTVCLLNMWAYLAAYEMPNDDPERLAARVHVRYPIAVDRAIGLGGTPTVRLQRAFSAPGTVNRFERVLVWCHWMWFLVPHGSVGYVLLRDGERFPSAAARMYAVFDLGAVFYWAIPTAPPWWAAQHGDLGDRRTDADPADDDRVRRAVLGRQLGRPLRCPRRKSACCHAVASFRHFSDGRPPALGGRTRRRRGRMGIRWRCSASRSSTSVSTTSPICSPGPRWPRPCGWRRRGRCGWCAASRARAGARGEGGGARLGAAS